MEGIAHIYVINFQASLFPLTFAPAPQQGQLKVSSSYMNVTSHSVTSGRHLIPSTKLTSSSHKTFHLSYMKFLDEMFIKVKVSSILKGKKTI